MNYKDLTDTQHYEYRNIFLQTILHPKDKNKINAEAKKDVLHHVFEKINPEIPIDWWGEIKKY